jgi:hypothetical protein
MTVGKSKCGIMAIKGSQFRTDEPYQGYPVVR